LLRLSTSKYILIVQDFILKSYILISSKWHFIDIFHHLQTVKTKNKIELKK